MKMEEGVIRIEEGGLWKDYWIFPGEINSEIFEPYRLRRFNHPNIVKVLDIKLTPPSPSLEEHFERYSKDRFRAPSYFDLNEKTSEAGCLSFQLERGDMDLEKYLEINPELGREERLRICFKIAQALFCLHNSGLIHGDLKPMNVVMFGQEPKLIDLGFSLYAEDIYLVSTPFYGSYRPNSKRADLYSLGLMFNHILTGMEKPEMKGKHDKLYSYLDHTKEPVREWEAEIKKMIHEPLLSKMVDQDIPLTIEEVIQDPIFTEVFYEIEFDVFPALTTLDAIYEDVFITLGEPEEKRDLYYYFLIALELYSGMSSSISDINNREAKARLTRLTGLVYLYPKEVALRANEPKEVKNWMSDIEPSANVLRFLDSNPDMFYRYREDYPMFQAVYILRYLTLKQFV